MNESSPGAGPRQAALTLHSLAEADRAWLLECLSPVQRTVIAPLLRELHELGIPADAVAMVPGVHEAAAHARPGDELHDVDIGSFLRILADEPPRLTAIFLAARPRPWRDRFLASLVPDQARLVQAEASTCTPTPALQAAVLRAIRSRSVPASSEQRGSSFWQRCRKVVLRRRA